MLRDDVPDWLAVARRNRLLLEALRTQVGDHVTHRRGRKGSWRKPEMEPFTPKGRRR